MKWQAGQGKESCCPQGSSGSLLFTSIGIFPQCRQGNSIIYFSKQSDQQTCLICCIPNTNIWFLGWARRHRISLILSLSPQQSSLFVEADRNFCCWHPSVMLKTQLSCHVVVRKPMPITPIPPDGFPGWLPGGGQSSYMYAKLYGNIIRRYNEWT